MGRFKYMLSDGGGLQLEERTARLYSSLTESEKIKAARYFTYYFRNPDFKDHEGYPPSKHEFGKMIGIFRYLFGLGKGECLTRIALGGLNNLTRRDTLLLYNSNQDLIGHAAYQIHSNKKRPLEVETDYKLNPNEFQLHMFQIAIDSKKSDDVVKDALMLLGGLISIGKKDSKICLVRFGGGSNPKMKALNWFLTKKHQKYGIESLGKGYFKIK